MLGIHPCSPGQSLPPAAVRVTNCFTFMSCLKQSSINKLLPSIFFNAFYVISQTRGKMSQHSNKNVLQI